MMDNKKVLINYPKNNETKQNKFQRLFDYLSDLKNQRFTGYIKINFSEGNIGRTEKFEEILKQK